MPVELSARTRTYAAEVAARPSATFLRLTAEAPLPPVGRYRGRLDVGRASAPCGVRVVDDEVFCHVRGPLPPVAMGARVNLTLVLEAEER